MGRLTTLRNRVPSVDLRIAKPPPEQVDSFYTSPPWRKLIARLIGERGRRCEDCGRTGCRIFGDHIVEIKDGGAKLDPKNVKLRCGSCHGLKTAAEKRKREARGAAKQTR